MLGMMGIYLLPISWKFHRSYRQNVSTIISSANFVINWGFQQSSIFGPWFLLSVRVYPIKIELYLATNFNYNEGAASKYVMKQKPFHDCCWIVVVWSDHLPTPAQAWSAEFAYMVPISNFIAFSAWLILS